MSAEVRHFAQSFYEVACIRARQGLDVLNLNQVIHIEEQNLCGVAFHDIDDVKDQLAVVARCHEECDTERMAIMRAFGEVTRALLQEAETLVEQMSSPILPVSPGTIVLPLVGAVNTRRAARIMQALLAGIVAHGASLVILDVTGVPVMDIAVADSLAQTARACRLLGAHVVVVGVSTKVAQTLVELNADLSGIMTLMNLRAGLDYALRRSTAVAARISPG
jgi:anti-anti-sigma regulatory factor